MCGSKRGFLCSPAHRLPVRDPLNGHGTDKGASVGLGDTGGGRLEPLGHFFIIFPVIEAVDRCFCCYEYEEEEDRYIYGCHIITSFCFVRQNVRLFFYEGSISQEKSR